MANDLFELEQLESELGQLQEELVGLKARWPAHSVKPLMLIQLEELEERIKQIKDILFEKSGL